MPKLALLGGEPVRRLDERPYPKYPSIGNEEIEAVIEVMRSGNLSSLRGHKVKEFEEAFAKYHGVPYAIAVSSGTTALHLALAAIGVGPGDEVIVPAYTFTSTATSVLMQCAIPVFADIDSRTFTIDPEDVERKVTEHTRAIIVVHLFGCPADMDRIKRIAEEYDIAIVEDCAQAHGAMYKGKKVGTIGDAGCFSFYQSKNMMTGEGGMIITRDPDIAERVSMLRNHAEIRGLKDYLKRHSPQEAFNMLGYNYRMTELQAAIGLVQLRKLDRMNEARRRIASEITKAIREIAGLEEPYVPDYAYHVFHIYAMKYYEEELGVPRDLFIDALRAEGVPASPGYEEPLYANPLYRLRLARKLGCPFTCPYYKGRVTYEDGICPVAEEICYRRGLWLLIHSELSDDDVKDIVEGIRKVVENIDELKRIRQG